VRLEINRWRREIKLDKLIFKKVFFLILTIVWWILSLSYFANSIGLYSRGYLYPSILYFITSLAICPLIANKFSSFFKINTNVIQIITLLLNVFFSVALFKEFNGTTTKPVNESNLPKIDLFQVADSINKHMPFMINRETRADNVAPNTNLINYNLTLVNFTLNELDTNLEKIKMEKKLRNGICSDHQYDKFLKNGIAMQYSFHDRNGVNLFSIMIKQKDCEN
jgi:hypothetical protein